MGPLILAAGAAAPGDFWELPLAAFASEVRVVAPLYLHDAKMNRVYAPYFPETRPSRTTAAHALPRQDRGLVKGTLIRD